RAHSAQTNHSKLHNVFFVSEPGAIAMGSTRESVLIRSLPLAVLTLSLQCLLNIVAQLLQAGSHVVSQVNPQRPPSALRQYFEIATRLCGLHQAERVFLIRYGQIVSVVAGHLQEDTAVRPTFIRLSS